MTKLFNFCKKMIPVSLKKNLILYFRAQKIALPPSPRVFIFLAADYGNIGDLAITSAQHNFLNELFPSHRVVQIPISKTHTLFRSVAQQISKYDLITIVGGGNMGSLYPDIEELRQLVIRSFPKNRIVCFPQTLDWDESAESHKALRRIVRIYSRHPDIHLCARESITYAKFKTLFKKQSNVKICFVPDIVMSATAEALGATDSLETKGILSCLRDDKESALGPRQRAMITAFLENTGHEIHVTDTHAGGSQLKEAYRAKLLADKLNQFRSAKLVVTDRLHGMILCLLSGTPCLVLPNSNHKIRQTWLDWLQHHPRIIFVEATKFDEIPNYINQLLTIPRGYLNESPIESLQYDSLRNALLKE